ncbi:MAG TPA: thioesterase family protein [Candidatus Udaeobacter sp.]|jgi:acyl-CoA thioester hydrolase|nr:thioesterase family protein [Candidatus Udaeobacter sp.]
MLHLLFVEQRHFVAPYSSKGRSLRTAQAQRGLQSLPRKKLGETTEIFGFAQDDSAVFEVNFHSMCSTPFETTVSVKPGDIDGQNHVNNTVYLRWVQEVATAHWQTIAASEAQEGIGWVVLRHEIDYKAPACMGDEVVLRTWVGKATRLTFERFTEMFRSSDGQLLSKARTLWCPINAQTGRPVRVSPEVRKQFSV